jgi:hypothetical protein
MRIDRRELFPRDAFFNARQLAIERRRFNDFCLVMPADRAWDRRHFVHNDVRNRFTKCIRGGDQRMLRAGNADGFIVRFFCVACNEWTASRQAAMPRPINIAPTANMISSVRRL